MSRTFDFIVPEHDDLLPVFGKQLLKDFYLEKGETTPQEAFARAAYAYSFGDDDFAKRIYDYASRNWFMYASPVLSNAPFLDFPHKDFHQNAEWLEQQVKSGALKLRGQAISCFLIHLTDTRQGIVDTWAETAHLTYLGGGIGIHCMLRTNEGKSTGAMANLHVTDSQMLACKQGDVRRGSAAVYMNVRHPEFREFLNMRRVGGKDTRKNFNLHNAIIIPDAFMEAVKTNSPWTFVDPNSGKEYETVSARELWREILTVRSETGEPYFFFEDTANRALPESQKKRGLKINGSNLCNEIYLPTNEERTAVCCLSSINLEKWDEWKDNEQFVPDLIRFLDNVLEFFVRTAPSEVYRAIYSAKMERALGLGAMGFHSLLQSKMIPFESGGLNSAAHLNGMIFNKIKKQAVEASKQLAVERGEPQDMIGTGLRNSHLLAIAPNSNNSAIIGTSPSIEPWDSNYFVSQTRAGDHVIRNKYLDRLLTDKGINTPEIWKSIADHDGSVQHLEELDKNEKAVFKTAMELDQMWVIEHVATRQQFICQGQSTNLFFPAGAPKKYIEEVHWQAWKKGLKGLYYFRTKSKAKAEKVEREVTENKLVDGVEQAQVGIESVTESKEPVCRSCEG